MYGKLFEQMYDGTLATEGPWQALVTFQQLVILADRNGQVDMTPEAISRRTTIPLKIIQQGLAVLERPDPQSRTPDEDGCRIIRLSGSRPWGWRIVNHGKYRAIRSQQERRAYMRDYQSKRRQTARGVNQDVNNCKQVNPPLAESTNSSKQEAVPPIPPHNNGNGKPRRRRQRLPATPCPTSFDVTDEMSTWAVGEGIAVDRVMLETEQFLDHHRGKGNLQADWVATWRTWIRNAVKFKAARLRLGAHA